LVDNWHIEIISWRNGAIITHLVNYG